jgi:hypothetical protein
MNDERFLKDWLHDTSESVTDPQAAADKVVARLHETPQRRQWLPRPPIRRGQPHETITRRTRLMLNPIQAVLAGALTLAASGVMLVVMTFNVTTTMAPSAETSGAGELTSFEGYIGYEPATQLATRKVMDNGVTAMREQIWTIHDAETSDPRFGGTIINTWNWDEYQGGGGFSVWTGGWSIENDEGGWHERPQYTFAFPDETYPVITTTFDGVGAYEGLTAIVEITEEVDRFHLRGVITDGPLPPIPTRLRENATD